MRRGVVLDFRACDGVMMPAMGCLDSLGAGGASRFGQGGSRPLRGESARDTTARLEMYLRDMALMTGKPAAYLRLYFGHFELRLYRESRTVLTG